MRPRLRILPLFGWKRLKKKREKKKSWSADVEVVSSCFISPLLQHIKGSCLSSNVQSAAGSHSAFLDLNLRMNLTPWIFRFMYFPSAVSRVAVMTVGGIGFSSSFCSWLRRMSSTDLKRRNQGDDWNGLQQNRRKWRSNRGQEKTDGGPASIHSFLSHMSVLIKAAVTLKEHFNNSEQLTEMFQQNKPLINNPSTGSNSRSSVGSEAKNEKLCWWDFLSGANYFKLFIFLL